MTLLLNTHVSFTHFLQRKREIMKSKVVKVVPDVIWRGRLILHPCTRQGNL